MSQYKFLHLWRLKFYLFVMANRTLSRAYGNSADLRLAELSRPNWEPTIELVLAKLLGSKNPRFSYRLLFFLWSLPEDVREANESLREHFLRGTMKSMTVTAAIRTCLDAMMVCFSPGAW